MPKQLLLFVGVLLWNCYTKFFKEDIANPTWVRSTIATRFVCGADLSCEQHGLHDTKQRQQDLAYPVICSVHWKKLVRKSV